MERRIDNQDELIAHYKQRLRALLTYAKHLNSCAYSQWQVQEFLQKAYGVNYSAGLRPPCDCGAAAVVAIVNAEVYDENGNPV